MAYRPYVYVPQPYKQDDGRVNDLILQQAAIQADRTRQQGLTNALMWRGMGQAASGMLSDLAQYKREAPARAEAERVRREKDKLRGLEQMAGAGGMSEQQRGELLKHEGFAELGQSVLDKDTDRRAKQAVIEDAQNKREDDILSRITQTLYRVQGSRDPESAYNSIAQNIKAELPEKYRGKLPDLYDQDALQAFVQGYETSVDVREKNAEAKRLADEMVKNETTLDQRVAHANQSLGLQLSLASTQEAWDNAWKNIDAYLNRFDEKTRRAILAEVPFSREFSDANYQKARDLTRRPGAQPNAMSLATEQFRQQFGYDTPRTQVERDVFNDILAEVSDAAAAGRGGAGGDVTTYMRNLTNEYWDRRTKIRADARTGGWDDATTTEALKEVDDWFAQQKAAVSQMGTGRRRGGGGGAAGQPTITGDPGPGATLVLSPDGTQARWVVPGNDAAIQKMVSDGFKIIEGGQQQPPPAGNGNVPTQQPPPQQPPQQPPVGGGAPLNQQLNPQPPESPRLPTPTLPQTPPQAALTTPGITQAGAMANWMGQMGGGVAAAPAPPRPAPQSQGPPNTPMGAPGTMAALAGRMFPSTPMGGEAVPPQPAANPLPIPPRAVATPEAVQFNQQTGGGRMLYPSAGVVPAAPPRSLKDAAGALVTPAAPAAPVAPVARPNATPEQKIQDTQVSINEATPASWRFDALAYLMKEAGYEVVPISKMRTAEEQAKLYAKGRTSPGTIVTEKTGKPGDESKHQSGNAVDFAFLVNGKPSMDPNLPWHLLGMAAKKLGLGWGGDWTTLVDRPHVQMEDFVGPVQQ